MLYVFLHLNQFQPSNHQQLFCGPLPPVPRSIRCLYMEKPQTIGIILAFPYIVLQLYPKHPLRAAVADLSMIFMPVSILLEFSLHIMFPVHVVRSVQTIQIYLIIQEQSFPSNFHRKLLLTLVMQYSFRKVGEYTHFFLRKALLVAHSFVFQNQLKLLKYLLRDPASNESKWFS